ncbi:protein of unknown function [Atopomonas hussainii]|uniref:DUF4824 domain-containing protein n=1 Tax=Atopomonas hussainii TaxID=1429083 RepID=A0A1H7FI39_9GAMM|nr:DUF4824 family protein [Atopomonas hussainii]SEK25454.1 protein of unknown function [Atopomonas hussainii]
MLTPRRSLWLGLAVILGTNAIVLAGVWQNRAGVPDSSLRFSERELRLDQRRLLDEGDDSGLLLELRWQYPDFNWRYDSAWLSQAALHNIGFNVPKGFSHDERERYIRQLSRPAYLLLELDGPAYQTRLKQADDAVAKATEALRKLSDKQQRQRELDDAQRAAHHERTQASRLILLDADSDAARLRERYPDRSRYLIVPGRVSPGVRYANHEHQEPYYTAFPQLLNEHIHVPASWRERLADWPQRWQDSQSSRFISVHYGQRYEPWLAE